MPNHQVRIAATADVELVVAIGRETYPEHFAQMWSAEGLRGFLDREFDRDSVARELASAQVRYLLAESAGVVSGFAKLRFPKPLSIAPTQLGVELQKLYLRKHAVGQGIGAKLLEECVRQMGELGLELIWLNVLERNAGAARFYARHGFETVATEQFTTDRGSEPMLLMVKRR
jgi:ribosomal protein S18 acetylase RimI-like enzyme